MSEYQIRQILTNSPKEKAELQALLNEVNLKLDNNIDYILGLYAEDNLIATAACYENTLRCLAVQSKHQGEGLLSKLVSEIIRRQFLAGYNHIFVYTKLQNQKLLEQLGFYLIAKTDNIVFLENKSNGFSNYLENLAKESHNLDADSNVNKANANNAAIVMNANPFTKGHLYLIKQAAKQVDTLHVFVVSAEHSVFPFQVRKMLVKQGSAMIKNIVYHDTGSYMISTATFPAYFQASEDLATENQAELEAVIFSKIAKALNIQTRFLGEEPISHTTAIYNSVLKAELTKYNLNCNIIQRSEADGSIISASKVRQAIKVNDWQTLNSMLPESSLKFLKSEKASQIIERIKASK